MRTMLFFVILAVCWIGGTQTRAQGNMPKGQLFTIHEDAVIPSMVERYERAVKNLGELIAKNNIGSITYTAASHDNFVYTYITPVENMAGVDKVGAGWIELEQKAGKDNFSAAMKQFDGCYPSHKNYLVRSRPELSYNGEYGAAIADGMLFRHYDFYFIHPGMEDEADNIAKEWVALSKKVGMPEGYRLYSGSYGTDGPVFVVSYSAKSAAEFYAGQEAWMKKAGDEAKALWAKTWKVVRRFESVNGRIRPDLSVLPKEMKK